MAHTLASLPATMQAYLQHVTVERRLAARTHELYRLALADLATRARAMPIGLEAVQPHHVRRWLSQLRDQGLGPRSCDSQRRT